MAGAVRAGRIEAITRPSGDVTLSFVAPGCIARCLVAEGDRVKKGQLIVQQDDAAEQAELAQLKAQAEDTTRIKAAQAQLDQKNVDLKKLQRAAERAAATELEVEHARLDVTIAELALALSRFQREQDRRRYEQARLQIERMKLTSPIAGRVEKIFAQVGESVASLSQVVRVVRIDPLWIDVPVPLAQAAGLKAGAAAQVVFGGEHGRTVEGKITYVASEADAASGTLTVRVEVANRSSRPAGEHVVVSFPGAAEADPPKKDKE